MQNIYTQKTPFGTFRSDKPLSHGVSVFLILQSVLYFDLGIMALCGLLYNVTESQLNVDRIVFWSVALVFTVALAVCSIVIVSKRIKAFERFRKDVICFSLLEDPANALTADDQCLVAGLCLGAPDGWGAPITCAEEQNARNDAVTLLYHSVGTDKRGDMLAYASRTLLSGADKETNPLEKSRLRANGQKLRAHYLKDRVLRRIKGDPSELLRSLELSVSFVGANTDDTDDSGYRPFTVTIPEKTVRLSDGHDGVIDGFFRVSVREGGETVSTLVCMLPLNGTAERAVFTGYYPAFEETPEVFCEPISLWITEKP